MASLRDVLNHAGKRVRVGSEGSMREGLAMRRADLMLLEPQLEPKVGEPIEVIDTSERLTIQSVEPQDHLGRVDHFRCKVTRG